jgi:beta-aspartyl-peptidase (threonine type)
MRRNRLTTAAAWPSSSIVVLREGWNGKNQQCGQCQLNRFHRLLRMPLRVSNCALLFFCLWRDIPNHIKYNPASSSKLRWMKLWISSALQFIALAELEARTYDVPVTTTTQHAPTLLVHGGAWAIPADAAEAHQAGVRNALEAGYKLLSRGASSLDAVEAAVTVLEDDPTFDAGRGSFLTSDGRVQLDALLMDGGRMKAGGVACVEQLRNPIQAARLVLEKSPHVYFVANGAEQFAQAHGMTLIDNAELVLERERERLAHAKLREAAGLGDDTFSGPEVASHPVLHDDKGPDTAVLADHIAAAFDIEDGTKWSHDTVGAVALDADGNLSAATSTGGTLNKTPGRVGDSSLIGCGCYADNLAAAVSLTGWGEPIMKLVLGKWATDRVASGTAPEMAAREAIAYLFNRLGGHGGIILLGPDGRFGMAHNTPAMAWGVATPDGLQTGLTV